MAADSPDSRLTRPLGYAAKRSLCESSRRLMTLLHGGRVAKPPLWEPWFMMKRLRDEVYGGWAGMCADLDHAAVCTSSPNTRSVWRAHVDADDPDVAASGVWYGGGALRERSQLASRGLADYDAQLAEQSPWLIESAGLGRARWVVLPWCFHAVATSMGLEGFALACYDEPAFVREAMAWVEQRNRDAVDRFIAQVKPDFVLIDGDCAYRTGTMIDPAMLRDFTFEQTAKTIDRVHALGLPVAFHSDGKLDEVIPMLVELGVAAVHGCESQANDLAELVERFGDSIVLCGNMDVVFLAEASPEAVRSRTLEMLRIGSRKGRFAAGCNTSPLDYIPAENYQMFCRTIRDYQPGD